MSSGRREAGRRLLEVEGLVTRYPISRGCVGTSRARKLTVHAVDGVSFTVGAGRDGGAGRRIRCGKTTTAQTVIRMVDSESGLDPLPRQEIAGLGARELRPLRREMQIIYQDPYESLDPRFRCATRSRSRSASTGSARRAGARGEGARGAGAGRADAARAVHRPLPARALRRAAPAGRDRRALVLEPKLLVADEPVSMLDVSVRAGILSLLDGLRKERHGRSS